MVRINIVKLILITLIAFLSACVGEVETSQAKKTEFFDPTPDTFIYQGIIDARAIAHNKIEIDFYPAGDPSHYVHYLQINGSNTPIELKLDTIPRIDGGIYRYALSGLAINSYYTLKITAENLFTGDVSKNERVIENVKTFDNRTADFKGIAKVSAVPGSASSSVIVEWNPALFEGIISASSYDPVYYEIIYISEAGGYSNLNNSGYSGPDRVVVKGLSSSGGNISYSDHPTFKKITGLVPDTTYYFQVRAVHKTYKTLFDADPNNVPINRELNSVYIRYRTSALTNFVDFDTSSIVVNNSPSDQAFDSFRVNWEVGEGTYTHYRLFVTEYEGTDIANDDELILSELDPAAAKLEATCFDVPEVQGLVEVNLSLNARDNANIIGCFDIPTTVYNLQIKQLLEYTGYHIKVALCREADCTLDPSSPNVGILSEIRYITTEPTLATFDGINFLVQPQDPTNLNQISMTFNAPDIGQGYADTLEVYCLDPDNYSNRDLFPDDGSAIGGSANVSRCANLSLETTIGGPMSSINSFGSIGAVSALNILGTENQPHSDATYCFAITPAITQRLGSPAVPEYRMSFADMVVRCISPEVKVPTSDEFLGVNGSCNVNENNASVIWAVPSGGIYENYTVFMKKKDANSFNFGNAIANPIPHNYTIVEPVATTNYTFTNLDPGATYEIGVLTVVEDGGGNKFYSEPNLNVVECRIPLPIPSFNEWTRVFAIGPKINGRFPTVQSPTDDNPWPAFRTPDMDPDGYESRLFEAISVEGIPYEVNVNDSLTFWSPPPGDSDTAGIPTNPFVITDSNTFDGQVSPEGYAASKTGIISIAWKDVTLSYLDTEFQNNQDAQGHDRSARNFGYRVYRSANYGLSYQLVSGNRLIRAIDYTYRPRANAADVVERMAFFTDYSVRYADDYQDISRARIYQYKVVPVYNGIELAYVDGSGSPQHMIRITLPPPNMALVHRKMANRSTCLELNKDIEHVNNYICEYNGLGARPRFTPWIAGSSIYDLGGDLLIDRFELGCNFTRGELPSAIGSGLHVNSRSHFDMENDPAIDYESSEFNTQALTDYSIFMGLANNGSPFRGCAQKGHHGVSGGLDNAYERYDDDLADIYWGALPTYNDVIYGDCYGASQLTIPSKYGPAGSQITSHSYNTPGLRYNIDVNASETFDHTSTDTANPHYAHTNEDYPAYPGLFSTDLRRSRLAIGDYAAVFYNSSGASGYPLEPIGPGLNEAAAGEGLISYNSDGSSVGPNCFVNLASIGANQGTAAPEYWRSRWFAMGMLDTVITKSISDAGVTTELEATESIYGKTLNEISQSKGLYDDHKASDQYFKTISPSFWDTNRIVGDMPLARVASTNNAKVPGLYGLSPREYNQVCNTYKVQVGVQSDGGAFSSMSAPQQKRILRRGELIVSAAFPDNFTEEQIDYIELGSLGTFDSNLYVNGKSPASCHSQTKANYPAAFEKNVPGESYDGRVTETGVTGAYGGIYKRIMTGSGLGEGGLSTESCTSKYGIQDLTGNGIEMSSEELFCDYGQASMAIYFGKQTAGTGDRDWSVIYPYNNHQGGGLRGVMINAPLKYMMDPSDITGTIADDLATLAANRGVPYPTGDEGNWSYLPDGDTNGTSDGLQRNNNAIWKYVFADAGYCSLVDSDKDRVETLTNFRSLAGVVTNVFNPDGSINTSMILNENSVDQDTVDYMRNGDGYFLNFGDTNLGPSMSLTGSLALESTVVGIDERMRGKYFNPVVGFPLSCDTYGASISSCDPVQAGDNAEYTLENFWPNHGGYDPLAPAPPSTVDIPDFPIGNSKIETIGLSEVDGASSTTPQNVVIDPSSGAVAGRLIEEFSIDIVTGVSTPLERSFAELAGTTQDYFHMRWAIPRGSVLIFGNGEKGRFSLRTMPRNSGNVYGHDKSARCALKINEDI